MADAVLKSDDLRKITGLSRDADIRRTLEKQGIAVFDGKDGIWTTYELIKVAGMKKMGLLKVDEVDKGWF